jgi:hypothetical protein
MSFDFLSRQFSLGDWLMRLLLSLALVVSCVAAIVAQDRASFPVPRAEQEFVALFPHIEGYGGAIRNDQKAFLLAVLPYAPLDLQITRAQNHEEADTLRNFYLGVVGAASGIDSAALANRFHCGKSCVDYRKSEVVGKLGRMTDLVAEFNAVPQIEILAQWGIKDEYRVNNVFHMMGQTNESLPSPVMGFVPSDKWRKLESPEKYLEEITVLKAKFYSILTKTKEMSLAALVRDSQGSVRVVRVGISDNEAGLFFLKNPSNKPKKGQKMLDGREYIYVEEIKPNIFYYETS